MWIDLCSYVRVDLCEVVLWAGFRNVEQVMDTVLGRQICPHLICLSGLLLEARRVAGCRHSWLSVICGRPSCVTLRILSKMIFLKAVGVSLGDNEGGRGFGIKMTRCLLCAIDSCEIAQFVRGQLCYLEIENNPGMKLRSVLSVGKAPVCVWGWGSCSLPCRTGAARAHCLGCRAPGAGLHLRPLCLYIKKEMVVVGA